MKIKNWEQFNELQMGTYMSAANKLRQNHPMRAALLKQHSKDMEIGKYITGLENEQIQFEAGDNQEQTYIRIRELDLTENENSVELYGYSSMIAKIQFSETPSHVTTNIVDRNSAKIIFQIFKYWFDKHQIEVDFSHNDLYTSR